MEEVETQIHPDDPDGFDHWRQGTCDSCNTKGLVRSIQCGAEDCTGCLWTCLPCEPR